MKILYSCTKDQENRNFNKYLRVNFGAGAAWQDKFMGNWKITIYLENSEFLKVFPAYLLKFINIVLFNSNTEETYSLVFELYASQRPF